MKKLIFASILLVSSASQASDYGPPPTATTYLTALFASFSTFFPTILTQCSIDNSCDVVLKVVVDAQEDAALYVATDGNVKTVKLEKALEVLRASHTENVESISDMEIAKAILSL
jgi:Protein of unknown function (DUF2388).